MLTWRAEDGHGLEGARLSFLHALAIRAQGRLVRPDFTASYRLIVGDDGLLKRLSVVSDTIERDRSLVMNRAGDGYWLLDTGSGRSVRTELGGAVDVDLSVSPMLNALPIRRLGLHREAGEHTMQVAYVTLPELEVRQVQQTYRTVSTLSESGTAVIAFESAGQSGELVVDADGLLVSYPGVVSRLAADAAAAG